MKKFSKVSILTGGGGSRLTVASMLNENRKLVSQIRGAVDPAFTMAEILLSLTIIGVVAAITLSSLTGNINERTWNTQRKALYARMSQALSLMPCLNSYGQYSGINTEGVVSTTVDTAAETFVTEGLSKVMKINNICATNQLVDCGIPTRLTNMVNSPLDWPTKLSELNSMFTGTFSGYSNPQNNVDTSVAAFETANGESIAVYYNPRCVSVATIGNYAQPKMCANFIYDLNGKKGPNTVGKDIGFITALYPIDPVIVAPMPVQTDAGRAISTDAPKICNNQDSESRLPNKDELDAMFYNKALIGISSGTFWSASVVSLTNSDTTFWSLDFNTGRSYKQAHGNIVRCIRR